MSLLVRSRAIQAGTGCLEAEPELGGNVVGVFVAISVFVSHSEVNTEGRSRLARFSTSAGTAPGPPNRSRRRSRRSSTAPSRQLTRAPFSIVPTYVCTEYHRQYFVRTFGTQFLHQPAVVLAAGDVRGILLPGMVGQTREGQPRYLERVKSGGRLVASKTFHQRTDALLWEREQYRRLALGDSIPPVWSAIPLATVAGGQQVF